MHTTEQIQRFYEERKKKISVWSTTQEEKGEFSPKIIKPIEETLMNQINLIANLQRFKNILEFLSVQDTTKSSENWVIKNYIKDLDILLRHLEVFVFLQDKETNPIQVVEILHQIYHSAVFKQIMNQFVKLTDAKEEIDAVGQVLIKRLKNDKTFDFQGEKIPQIQSLTHFSSMPIQSITRMNMPIDALTHALEKKLYEKIKQEIGTREIAVSKDIKLQKLMELAKQNQLALESLPRYNQLLHLIKLTKETSEVAISEVKAIDLQLVGKNEAIQLADKHLKNAQAEAKKGRGINFNAAVLRHILRLNINSPIQSLDLSNSRDFPHYLKRIVLSQLQPFSTESQEKLITSSKGRTNPWDPAVFNADSLYNLYKRESNPLWLVLASTKSIDYSFTPEQKVWTLISLAEAFKIGQLGKKEKYSEAYNLATQSIALAKKYPELNTLVRDHFGPESSLGKWIINKHKKIEQDKIWDSLTVKDPGVEHDAAVIQNRAPRKLAFEDELQGETEHRTGVYTHQVHEDSSTVSMKQVAAEVEFPTRSNESRAPEAVIHSPPELFISTLESELKKITSHHVKKRRREAIDKLDESRQNHRMALLKEDLRQEKLIRAFNEEILDIENQSNRVSTKVLDMQNTLSLIKSADKASPPTKGKIAGKILDNGVQKVKEQQHSIQRFKMRLQRLKSKLTELDVGKFDIQIQELQSKINMLHRTLTQVEEKRSGLQNFLQQEKSIQTKKERFFTELSQSRYLRSEDKKNLNSKIANSETEKEFENLNSNFELLKKLDEDVEKIIKNMEKRRKKGGLREFFSSAPKRKIENIINAYKRLTVDEKIRLAQLNEDQVEAHKKDPGNIGIFLQALQQNRGLISVKEAATGFKEFKNRV